MGTAATDDNTGMDEYKKWGERVLEWNVSVSSRAFLNAFKWFWPFVNR